MSDSPLRMTDWDAEGIQITPPRIAAEPAKSVQYNRDNVVAYIDDRGQPAAPDRATMARVWTKSGMRTVRLK